MTLGKRLVGHINLLRYQRRANAGLMLGHPNNPSGRYHL